MKTESRILACAVMFAALIAVLRPTAGSEGADAKALLKALPKSRISLAQGIKQATKGTEIPISAKFEMDDHGKLALSVYTVEKGLSTDAEHNVLKELAGSPEGETWSPATEVFKDVEHVARSAQQLAVMSMASCSLYDVVEKAEKAGTVYSITPVIVGREGRFRVLVASKDEIVEQAYDLDGKICPVHEEGGREECDEDDD